MISHRCTRRRLGAKSGATDGESFNGILLGRQHPRFVWICSERHRRRSDWCGIDRIDEPSDRGHANGRQRCYTERFDYADLQQQCKAERAGSSVATITVSVGNCLVLAGPNPSWDDFVVGAEAEEMVTRANYPEFAGNPPYPPTDFRAVAATTPQLLEIFNEIPTGGAGRHSEFMCNFYSDLLRDNPNDALGGSKLARMQLLQPYAELLAGVANCMGMLGGGAPDTPPFHSARTNLCP